MFPITNQGYASGLHWANTVTKTLPYTCIICNVTGLWSLSGASAQFRGSSGWANKPCRENHDKSVKQCLYRDGEMFQLFKIWFLALPWSYLWIWNTGHKTLNCSQVTDSSQTVHWFPNVPADIILTQHMNLH